ncbi:MAG: sigma-70 family RNA polymerase sigma factor [Deltaproteobacteria bacterium]|nr:sigma-70 family RNA polymerase sigma factor [Deltaproteobacteria bacterium]
MSEPDDHTLLTAWRAGDRAAGSVLFRRHFTALFRFFATKVDDARASDLTQSTLLAAVEARDRLQPDSHIRAYLFGIARRQLLMLLRTLGRHGTPASLSESCAEGVLPSPSAVLVEGEREALVVRALRRIPLDLQMLVELHYWEGMPTDRLAEIFDVPRGTIKSRLSRARTEARRALERLIEDPARRESSVQDFGRWVRRLRGRDASESTP